MKAFLGLTRHCLAPRDQIINKSYFRLAKLAAAFQAPQTKFTSQATHSNTRNMSAEATDPGATQEISFL